MLLHCVSFTLLFISSSLLTVIALPAVTRTTAASIAADGADGKQLRSVRGLNTAKIETPGPKQTTQVPKHSSVTSPGDEDEEDDDEETGYDEMVSYRSCKVSDATYRHREQIPRSDPCEICVCVDSEMYCLWKVCPREATTASTTQGTTPTGATAVVGTPSPRTVVIGNRTDESGDGKTRSDLLFTEVLTRERKHKMMEVTTPKSEATSPAPATSSPEPTVCYVMGVMYKLGEVLPRDTGTCLECSCSEGARVTCRPKDCVSQPDTDYLGHNNNLDMFDLDSF